MLGLLRHWYVSMGITRTSIPPNSTAILFLRSTSQSISASGKAARSCATDGRQCTMSPREPNFTTRMRLMLGFTGLLSISIENPANHISSGVILRIPGYPYLPAIGEDLVALGHGGLGVVCALRVNGRSQHIKDSRHVALIKYNNMIHTPQRRNKCHALVFFQDRAARAFEVSDGTIAVDCDHKSIAKFSGVLQVSNVTHMQDVKASVC